MSPRALHTLSRELPIVWPRQIAQFLALEQNVTARKVALYWRRDHTSIRHSRRVVMNVIATDPKEKARIQMLRDELGMSGHLTGD